MLRLCVAVLLKLMELAKPVEMPRLRCKYASVAASEYVCVREGFMHWVEAGAQ